MFQLLFFRGFFPLHDVARLPGVDNMRFFDDERFPCQFLSPPSTISMTTTILGENNLIQVGVDDVFVLDGCIFTLFVVYIHLLGMMCNVIMSV